MGVMAHHLFANAVQQVDYLQLRLIMTVSLDIGNGILLEKSDKFCYLGYMLSACEA